MSRGVVREERCARLGRDAVRVEVGEAEGKGVGRSVKMGDCVVWIRFFFFFQAEDGIRDLTVTGVQTCALPISFHDRRVAVHSPSSPDVKRRLWTLDATMAPGGTRGIVAGYRSFPSDHRRSSRDRKSVV